MARGGVREGAGRPVGSVGDYKEIKKDVKIMFRCTQEEAEKIKALAKESGKNVSAFIIDTILKK